MAAPAFKIRAATENDIPQVHTIYSHYVANTVLTFMQTAPPLQSMLDKFKNNTGNTRSGLPYLVAVDTDTEKTVLGFAYLSPFRGTMFSYGPTVELSLFLSPEYTHKGIGSYLLTELLSKLQDNKPLHRAVEHAGYKSHESVSDPMPVRNIIACMALDPEGRDQGEGLRKWYEQRGFVERGRLKSVGLKKGKW
jgi:L-amino acid N-acyltransferase YncA